MEAFSPQRALDTPRKFRTMSGRLLAAKEITRLIFGYELIGMCKDVAQYIADKPDTPFFEHVGSPVELRRDLAELEYDQFLLNNNLLTPEAALEILQKQFPSPKGVENLN